MKRPKINSLKKNSGMTQFNILDYTQTEKLAFTKA